MGRREESVGKNEALFREVNERIREIATFADHVEFLCECGDPTCAQPIAMSLAEYEAVRSDSARFALVPGHETPELERVVEDHGRYVVVEKTPGRPTDLAVGLDPRA